MSDNLYFLKNGKHHVDFPFQTPTYLTLAVIAQYNNEDRMKVIKDYFRANYRKNDYHAIKMIKTIEEMLNDKTLILKSG